MPKTAHILATLDFETDPFEHGANIQPFVWDFYDGCSHIYYWSNDDCVPRLIAYLRSVANTYVIYAHNGGKFDFLYLLPWVRDDKPLIISNRLVETKLLQHTIRDSFAAIPVALKQMDKDDIDYQKMRLKVRWKHKAEILKYLYKDTYSLYKFIAAYREKFGANQKTMAGAAIKQLKQFHKFEIMQELRDAKFREYFHGGRVECFQSGVIEMPLKIYDVNSMYPSVMREYLHPVSNSPIEGYTIGKKTCFVEWKGYSYGAVAKKDEAGSLRFPHGYNTWKCSIHEFYAGLDTGTIKPEKIVRTWDFLERVNFAEFIDNFYKLRLDAASDGDEVNKLFYKLVMNSSSGKFAQDPSDFRDYMFTELRSDGRWSGPNNQCWHPEKPPCHCGGWRIAQEPRAGYMMWYRPAQKDLRKGTGFYNVATAASITGAARSVLLRAIVLAKNPVYCDTDSLICEELSGVKIDSQELGAWKLEKTGTKIAIAGKKLYCVWDGDEAVKLACKGVRLTPPQIEAVALGEQYEYIPDAPTMKLDGRQVYTARTVRKTA